MPHTLPRLPDSNGQTHRDQAIAGSRSMHNAAAKLRSNVAAAPGAPADERHDASTMVALVDLTAGGVGGVINALLAVADELHAQNKTAAPFDDERLVRAFDSFDRVVAHLERHPGRHAAPMVDLIEGLGALTGYSPTAAQDKARVELSDEIRAVLAMEQAATPGGTVFGVPDTRCSCGHLWSEHVRGADSAEPCRYDGQGVGIQCTCDDFRPAGGAA